MTDTDGKVAVTDVESPMLERLKNLLGTDGPPQVLAILSGRVVGKASSAHVGQPVTVTIHAALPQGDLAAFTFVLDPEDAARFQDTVVVQPKEGGMPGEQERVHPEPQQVAIAVFAVPQKQASTEPALEPKTAEEQLEGVEVPPVPASVPVDAT